VQARSRRRLEVAVGFFRHPDGFLMAVQTPGTLVEEAGPRPSGAPGPDRRRRFFSLSGRQGAFLLAAGGYTILYVALTWPLVLSPAEKILANHSDGFVDMLLFWYARTGKLLLPWVDSLNYPWGAAVGSDHGFWLTAYLSVPLQWVMPLPLAFNTLCLLFFVATGLGVYALALEDQSPPGGAFLAGMLLVLSPAYLNELSQGIPESTGMQWLLIYLLLGSRLEGTEDPARRRSLGLWAGLFLALTWLGSWYLGVLALIFTLVLPLRRLGWTFLVAGAVVAMCLALGPRPGTGGPRYSAQAVERMIAAARFQSWETEALSLRVEHLAEITSNGVLMNSADLRGFLDRQGELSFRFSLPGWLLMALALAGALLAPRRAWKWAGLAALCLFGSLGPYLMWGGTPVGPIQPTSWFYEHLPGLTALRPSRLLLGTTLALALAAAHALPPLTASARLLAVTGLLFLQTVEALLLCGPHLALSSARVPAFYHNLAGQKERVALIEYPLFPFRPLVGKGLYYQTVHGQPLVNYDYFRPEMVLNLVERARGNSLLAFLMGARDPVWRSDCHWFAERGVGYVVLHGRVENLPQGPRVFRFPSQVFDRLRALFGPPEEPGDGLLVFDLRRKPEGEESPAVTADSAGSSLQLLEHRSLAPWAVAREEELGRLPYEGLEWHEARAWVRGRGARLVARQGPVVVASEPLTSDDWEWVRLDLPYWIPGDLRLTLEVPGAPRPYRGGAEVYEVSVWRPAAP
jgi:hypothetical protein